MKVNKLFLLITATVFTILHSSCIKVVEQLAQWDMPFEYTMDIPATNTIAVPVSIQSPEIATGINDFVSTNNSSIDKITSITLTKASADIKDSTGATLNFDFIQSITLFVNATGLSEAQLAQKINITPGSNAITFDVNSNIDLKNYFTKDKTSIRADVLLNQATTTKSIVTFKATLHVKANPLK